MPDGLYFPVLPEIEETIEPRVCGKASGIVVRCPESPELAGINLLHLVSGRIVFSFSLSEEPVHAVADARREIDVFEQCECRQPYLEVVRHSVLELVQESRLVEFGGLEINLVLQRGAVSEREVLVELLLAHSVLLLERIEAAHGESDVRQSERI